MNDRFAWRNEREAERQHAVRAAHQLGDDSAIVRDLCRNNPTIIIAACERLAPRNVPA